MVSKKDYSSNFKDCCSLVGNELNLLKIFIKWIHQKIVITGGKVRIMVGKTHEWKKLKKKQTVLIVYTV